MNDIICHLSPVGGIDDRIAKILDNGYSKEDIAILRGLYDMDHPNAPLINPAEEDVFNKTLRKKDSIGGDWASKILEAQSKLMRYKESQNERHLNELKDSTQHMAKTFNRLYSEEGWNVATKRNRINMVAAEFSQEVSRRLKAAQKSGIPITREQIVNGYKQDGKYFDGQQSIFEAIFNKFLSRLSEAMQIAEQNGEITDEELREYYIKENEKNPEGEKWSEEEIEQAVKDDRAEIEWANSVISEYPKILRNWSALCTFARMSLRDTEGVKLGQTFEYAAPTTPDNFSIDSPLEDTYDLEESVREAWMVRHNQVSAFGSLGSEVRRFLSSITDVDEDGNKLKDDLRYEIKMNPLEMHRYLSDILRGITTESGLIKKLKSLSEEDVKIKAVFDALAKAAQVDLKKTIDDTNKPKNPAILTQLLLDMHKNLVPYVALLKRGANEIYAKVLNKKANPLYDEFILRMNLHEPIDRSVSIYDKNGRMDWEKLARLNADTEEFFPSTDNSDQDNIFITNPQYAVGFYSNKFTTQEKKHYLLRASNALGIPATPKSIDRIFANKSLLKTYTRAIKEFRIETTNAIGPDSDVITKLKVIEKYKGIRPTIGSGYTADAVKEYDDALEFLNSRNMSYDYFRTVKYGRNQEDSKGAGEDRIIKMLDAVADVDTRLKIERRVPWFDRKGKTNSRFSDLTPSYMGDLVDKIHEFINEGDKDKLQSFIEDKWGHSSFFVKDINAEHGEFEFYNTWLQEMYNSITIDSHGNIHIAPDAMAKVFEFDEFLGSNINKQVALFENFTEKQHAEAMIKQFVQMLDQSKGKSKLAKYPCFILGDSGTQRFFTAKRYSKDAILRGMEDVFRQELERIRYVNATNKVLEKEGYKAIDNFSETANEFTMLKFLNIDFENGKYWKILTGNQNMTNAELERISREDAMDMAKEAIDTDALTDALRTYMNDAKNNFMKKLASVGVLAEGKNGEGVTTYTDTEGYFSKNIKWFNNSIDNLVDDFFWNTKYATIQQLQLFTVDPAFYDHRYPIKDLQKRYKEIYAPGKGVSIEARDYDGNLYITRPYERAAYFDDIAVSSKDVNPYFFKLMKATFGEDSPIVNAYTKNTLTDGQGFRSLSSYRAVKGMAGEWTRPMEEAYRRIMDIRQSGHPLTEADIKEIAQLAVIFQPIKPYLYTLEKLKISEDGQPDDFALIPVQHKYAEVVLIPELLQEGKLKDLALWMENHTDEEGNAAPIDLVASTKCVKVGAFGSAGLKDASTTEDINAALNSAFIHNLSWADYRIQSGVPEHLNHAQLFGTQIRKLILANIKKGNDYNYLSNIFGKTSDPRGPKVYLPGMGNVYLTGRNLISFYNCLIMSNLFDSYENLVNSASTNQALSDRLIQNIISNSNQAEDNAFGLSIIEDGVGKGDFTIPLAEPGMEHDASALLWSLFKKQVNKQRIKGGSAVQASALGLSGYENDGNLYEVVSPEGDNVLYDEIEMPFNLSYTSAVKKDVKLKFEDWCYTEATDDEYGHHEIGDLKLSGRIVYGEEAREYLSWPVSGRTENGRPSKENLDENGYDKNGYYVPLVEEKYKGILDIIAYRIPTERDYSMINCKVFRFSHPLAGGTMKVPSSRTTTAGFDFDIDKLYFFMREFAQTKLSDADITNIWSKIYDLKFNDAGRVIGGNEIYNALVERRKLDMSGMDQLKGLSEVFDRSTSWNELVEGSGKNGIGKLHEYWESAGLEGTDAEAFTKYLEDHRDEYPVFDTYDPTISPLENSKASRNNMLIDLMRQRLMDPETLKARYTPGGFENNRDAALKMRILQYGQTNVEVEGEHIKIIRDGKVSWEDVNRYAALINEGKLKDPEPEYDPSDPTAILVYNQQNQVAGKLIGIFANQNTNHVYASTLHELGLRNPIKFGGHTARGLSDMLNPPEGVDVDTNVSEYLAASVDAVKDPVLNFLNLNLTTADAGALLARIGYTPQEIGLLFNQPVIKDICNYIANEGVSTDTAIIKMLKKYGGNNVKLDKISFDSSQVTSDRLAANIISQRQEGSKEMSTAFKNGQLQVLWLFNELLADTADLNSFVQCTRFTAANSVGSTWGDQIAQEDRVKAFIDKYVNANKKEEERSQGNNKEDYEDNRRLHFQLFDPTESRSERVVSIEEANISSTNQGILNVGEELLDLSPEEYMTQMSRNPLAFEQCMMDLARKASKKLFSKFFPYYTKLYKSMRDTMKELTKSQSLDADTINSLHREFIMYLLSNQKGSAFDGEALWRGFEGRSGFTNREYYTEVFPQVLIAAKDQLSKYPFFRALTITGDSDAEFSESTQESGEKKAYKIIVQGMGGLQSSTSNLITEAWAQAFKSSDKIHIGELEYSVGDLAKDAYFYNFYKMGFNFHPNSFINLAPTLLKLGLRADNIASELGYIDFIKDVIDGKVNMSTLGLASFAKQYILNHLDNKKFVFTPKDSARDAINKYGRPYNEGGGYWNSSFSISLKDLGNSESQFKIKNEGLKKKGLVAFRPVIAIEHDNSIAYYMADAPGDKFNATSLANGTMRYKLVTAQGIKGQKVQYFGSSAFDAYQRSGNLSKYNILNSYQMTSAEYLEDSSYSGSEESEVSYVDVGDKVSDMFTQQEWKDMYNLFNKNSSRKFNSFEEFKRAMSDTSEYRTVEILNDLKRRLDRGEKMETIDEEGNPIETC